MPDRNASTSLVTLSAAAPERERVSTNRHTTRRRVRHAWLVALAASLAACGGGHRTDSYKQATSEQEQCCEHLQGAPRDQCLGQIVRVDDPAIANADANNDTFGCIESHFVCDPATGHATQASAQDQYDCIVSLNE
jgi:hypothetical protein